MTILHPHTINDVKDFIGNSPHVCAAKNKESVFLHANTNYARLVGFKHSEDFIGRTDFDLPCGASQCATLFRAQDQDVMRTTRVMKILDVHPEAEGKWYAFLTTKSVFYGDDGQVSGTFFQMQDITSHGTLQFCVALGNLTPHIGRNSVLNQFSYMLGAPKPLGLTPRQEQVLFFIVRRKPIKKIALALGVCLRTVYNELEKLKTLFNASNINELIDKTMIQGSINIIPDGLSFSQMSTILHEGE
jgi:DNA-binding CsgD family transcriptional regulator